MLLIHNAKALFEESWNSSRRQEAVKYLAFVIVALWIAAALKTLLYHVLNIL